ncbi:MAG: quinoprotein dehydrogenase-associated putative ABC transporter substrate-binding protein [Pseudomonadota bacterium]|jgi:quinoprotein dehydrogenase-associated probable ABC transporter substrate-binding protein|nr:quinoprotein dehydrogenase-associated putative ABC transporter substrate-binding protein [Pseudomonadota bacterium]
MMPRHGQAHGLTVCVATFCAVCALQAAAARGEGVLKVCADPSNLPLSNDKGEGYENKIAEALARDLKMKVEYTFFPQRIGFIRNTLRSKDEQSHEYKCDLIIGVPKEYELTATTQPYMHSTYALIFSSRSDFAGLRTAEDLLKLPREKLDALHIGVFTKSPGADWVLKHGLMDHAAVYSHQNGDVDESPARTIGRDLANGKIDAAVLWGPIAGMLVQQRDKEPKWRAVPFEPDPAIKFDYEISMGLRTGEKQWKDTLDGWISAHHPQIDSILTSYNVPLVDTTGHVSSNAKDGNL